MTTAIETNRYQITPDEDAIQQAFVELNEKLSQWTAAMLDAQAALTEPTAIHKEEEPACESSEFEEVYCKTAQSTAVEERPIETQAEAEWAEPELSRDEQVETDTDAPGQIPQNEVKLTPAFGEKARASDDVKSESVSQDDEKLLASLDPETAKAIKIMRRLNPGKKSVKELLAEYQAAPTASASDHSKKKSWWR